MIFPSNPIRMGAENASQSPGNFPRAQTDLWSLNSRAPSPTVLSRDGIGTGALVWFRALQVPAGTHMELREILLYNGDAAPATWKIVINDPLDPDPTSVVAVIPGCVMGGTLASEAFEQLKLETGIHPGWSVWIRTEAALQTFNYSISGVVVTGS